MNVIVACGCDCDGSTTSCRLATDNRLPADEMNRPLDGNYSSRCLVRVLPEDNRRSLCHARGTTLLKAPSGFISLSLLHDGR